jgi:uncharacterized Fe-S cluster protein YjdI
MSDFNKEYTNGEVTVVWQPRLCHHSGVCARNLNSVFQPKEKPWININGASTEEIKNTIDKCPSGALSYSMNADANKG